MSRKPPPSQKRHGHSFVDGRATPEYNAWSSMKKRCRNPMASNFADYGGRGIQVCDRWASSFENFLSDMGLRPTSRHSLDRIDNDGDYEPGNCRWATPQVQSRNRRSSHLIQWRGESLTITEAAEKAGLSRSLVKNRLLRGWTVDRALS